MPDLAARPPSAKALLYLTDSNPHLLQPLAAYLLPPPTPIDLAEHVEIDLSSARTVEDCRQMAAHR